MGFLSSLISGAAHGRAANLKGAAAGKQIAAARAHTQHTEDREDRKLDIAEGDHQEKTARQGRIDALNEGLIGARKRDLDAHTVKDQQEVDNMRHGKTASGSTPRPAIEHTTDAQRFAARVEAKTKEINPKTGAKYTEKEANEIVTNIVKPGGSKRTQMESQMALADSLTAERKKRKTKLPDPQKAKSDSNGNIRL